MANAQTRCERTATRQITKFDKQIAAADTRFSERRNKMIAAHLATVTDPAERERVEEAFTDVLTPYNFEKWLGNSRKQKAHVREKASDESAKKCEIGKSTAEFFDETVDEYEVFQARALDALEDRIAIETVGPDEGLAVMAMYIDGPIMRLTLDRRGSMGGGRLWKDLPQGQYFRVIKLPAGDYQWTTVRSMRVFTRNLWADSQVYYFDLREDDLAFRIEPGKLNFTGVFLFSGSAVRASAELKDRSSIVMRLVENRYPDLLEKFPVFNGAVPDDGYLQFFIEERRLAAEAAP
ncbi:MAG: hypothetical protein AAGC71_17060 [Pseudomonadota bacterium]